MEANTFYYPSTLLTKYIDRFYVFEYSAKDQGELPQVLPGTGLELVYYLGKPLSVNGDVLPKMHTVCPRTIMQFDPQESAMFLSVRFKSGAFRHFTSVPFSALNNQYISATTLWGNKATELIRKLDKPSKLLSKVQYIETFLIEMFNQHYDSKNDKWDKIIDELYYYFDLNTITELAKKSDLSLRQFERNFKVQFGITAKEFQKISRFQTVTKKILFSKNPDYLGIILDGGYFDQNHFIKEFKAYTGTTPKQYFLDVNFDDRLYYNKKK